MKTVIAVLALFSIAVANARDAYSSPLHRAQRGANAHDVLLATLGEATVACLGSVSTTAYRVNSAGTLERTFDACATRDLRALDRIDRLLGVQHSREAQQDRVSERFARAWRSAARVFPAFAIPQCPTWELLHVIDAPSQERVAYFAAQQGAAGIGKEYRWYKVSSQQCGSDGLCAVVHAKLCGAGFSDQFIVWVDSVSSSVIVDPAWWLTDYEYGSENPFTQSGLPYRHNMSYYGEIPGALYGSLERAGETCTRWSETAGKHYTDRKLHPLDCGGGWYCATYCY